MNEHNLSLTPQGTINDKTKLGKPLLWENIGFIGLILIAVSLISVFFLKPTFPSFDGYYHLIWGRELFSGEKPDFTLYAAPTEHPLYLIIAGLVSQIGRNADRLLVAVNLIFFGLLIVGTYQLAKINFGRLAGLASGFFVATSYPLLTFALHGYVDISFVMLLIWAGVFATKYSKCKAFVFIVLC